MTSNVTIVVGEDRAHLARLCSLLDRAGFSADVIANDDPARASSYLLIRNNGPGQSGIDYLRKEHPQTLNGIFILTSRLVDPAAALDKDETIHLPFDLLRALADHVTRGKA